MTDAARLVIDAIVRSWAVPGCSVAAIRPDGSRFTHRVGHSDLDRRVPVAPGQLFQIGSISKAFNATVLLQLAEQGVIGLDTAVGEILDWLPDSLRANGITIRRLLNHTAGLISGIEALPDDVGQVALCDAALSGARPGTYFHYSNLGYLLLGLVATEVSGRPLARLVEEQILVPLGMRDSVAAVTNDRYDSLARGYQPRYDDRPWLPGEPLTLAPWFEVAGADGNLASTADDLCRFAAMLLGRGASNDSMVLGPNEFDAMITSVAPGGEDVLELPGVAATDSSHYGLGINVEGQNGRTVLTHGGGMVGYASFLLADLDAGLAVCVVTNANGDTPVAEAIARCVATELTAPGSVRVQRLDPRWWDAADIERRGLAGGFRSAGPATEPRRSIEVSVTERDGPLVRLSVSDSIDSAPLLRTWGPRAVTSLPALRRYALAPDRGRWFWGADEFAPSGADTPDPATPPELSAYCGHYRCYSPWFTNFRVVLRGDRLMLIAPGGVEAPGVDTELVPLGPNIFRIGADERVPERVIFGPPIHGAAPWADRDGCRYSRAFTD